MSDPSHVHQAIAPVERRVDAIQAVMEERGMKAGEFSRSRAPRRRAVGAAERRTRGREGVDRSGFQATPVRERPRRGHRTRARDAAPPSAPGGAREHADGAQRHLLHAVFVHRVHDHRLAARLVQGSGVPRAGRAPIAHRAEGDGARAARPRSRSASGTPRPIPATWCCRCSRPRRSAGRKTSWPRSSRRIR